MIISICFDIKKREKIKVQEKTKRWRDKSTLPERRFRLLNRCFLLWLEWNKFLKKRWYSFINSCNREFNTPLRWSKLKTLCHFVWFNLASLSVRSNSTLQTSVCVPLPRVLKSTRKSSRLNSFAAWWRSLMVFAMTSSSFCLVNFEFIQKTSSEVSSLLQWEGGVFWPVERWGRVSRLQTLKGDDTFDSNHYRLGTRGCRLLELWLLQMQDWLEDSWWNCRPNRQSRV